MTDHVGEDRTPDDQPLLDHDPDKVAGKTPLFRGAAATALKQAQQTMRVLPPHVVEVLDRGDVDEIIQTLSRGTVNGELLRTAFDYLRTKPGGPALVERLSREMFSDGKSDWLGMSQFLNCRYDDGDPTNDPRPLAARIESTTADAVEADDLAQRGIQLYVRADRVTLDRPDEVHPPGKFGPAHAGPYTLRAHSHRNRIVFWNARHDQRQQDEWIIGPDAIDAFERDVQLYAGAAARALPGSPGVPASQADGATAPATDPSLVQREQEGNAPWQIIAQGLDDTNGGTALVGGANAAVRLASYELPARQLAHRLYQDVHSGRLDHAAARNAAVDNRNRLLKDARKDMTPGARRASRAIKSDNGVDVGQMQERKVRELLTNYNGFDKKGRPLEPEDAMLRREILDADSELWAQHAEAAKLAKNTDAWKAAMRDLGESPEVSKAIIRSSGRPNRAVTALAGLQVAGGVVGAALGAIDVYQEIADADMAHKLHAAAGAWAGFTGGIVGAEAAVFFASLLLPTNVGAPVVLIVTIIAGAVGGGLGGHYAREAMDTFLQAGSAGPAPGHALAPSGGFAGAHQRDHSHGQNNGQILADLIFKLDQQIARFDRAIPTAKDSRELQTLQRERLKLLDERGDYEELLLAIRLGAFDANESRPFEPEPAPDAPTPPSPLAECPDDDCDREVW